MIGPTGFVAAWAISGARTKGYSPVDDAISLLAAVDAPTRWGMTAGFICFGVAVPVFALVLRRAFTGGAWLGAVISGIATLGVAAFPLHVSTSISAIHGACAGLGYIALASVPLLAGRALLGDGRRTSAVASFVVAGISAAALAATPVVGANGLFQRLGLTVVDVWLVATALTMAKLRRETPPAVVDRRKNDGRTGR